VSTAVSSTGGYPWTVEVKATYGSDTITRSVSGTSYVVVNGSTPFGHGWSLEGLDKLVSVTGGVMWVSGAGGTPRFYYGSSGTLVGPATDLGTLVKNGDNTYTCPTDGN
jgi:hypothetical protein